MKRKIPGYMYLVKITKNLKIVCQLSVNYECTFCAQDNPLPSFHTKITVEKLLINLKENTAAEISQKGIRVYSKDILEKGSMVPEHLFFLTIHIFNVTQMFSLYILHYNITSSLQGIKKI